MAIEEFIARKINPDGSTGTSKATIENHVVTYENSENPSPYITEIKTLNGVSLVGDGNYDFDTALNENSTNAVQNKVITEYITDLESKVSTLAVKVYNHDIALGALNIENTLYSVENTDSFAIPTTIGTNADVVIPKSRMALSAIKGKTEYSRNLIGFDDTTETKNGVTMTIKNGVWTLNGTATQETYFYPPKSMPNTLNGTYTLYGYGNGSVTLRCTYSVDGVRQYDFFAISNAQKNKTFNGTETNFGFEIIVGNGVTLNNVVVKPMLVQGSTAPTSFVPYYAGLKNVELNSLNVYGKTDNYTELRVGDKVTCIYISDEYAGPFLTALSFDNGLDVNGYSGWKGSHFGANASYFTNPISDFENIGNPNIYAFKVGVVYQLKAPSQVTLVSTDLIKNATSVKSILPSSILPKTLASYERLEVVDNGDDTYRVDLVSHAELHVGDEINSLWVGNPQADDYGSAWEVGVRFGDSLTIARTSSSLAFYNRMLASIPNVTNDTSSVIKNYSSLYKDGVAVLFGGDDYFINGASTNRNVVVEFYSPLTISSISSSNYFNSDFRNGEETRTTLIDGLSLDDVSTVIDTGDIVFADNSNAEYDVSIAETSVELLVNKAN